MLCGVRRRPAVTLEGTPDMTDVVYLVLDPGRIGVGGGEPRQITPKSGTDQDGVWIKPEVHSRLTVAIIIGLFHSTKVQKASWFGTCCRYCSRNAASDTGSRASEW